MKYFAVVLVAFFAAACVADVSFKMLQYKSKKIIFQINPHSIFIKAK